MNDEPDYFGEVSALRRELSDDTDEGRYRAIARQEADKRVATWLCWIGFFALLNWLPNKLSVPAWLVFCGLMGVWVVWVVVNAALDPQCNKHLIVNQAEDIVRLKLLSEAFNNGKAVWEICRGEYDTKKTVNVKERVLSDFWGEVFRLAVRMRGMAPWQRKRELSKARNAAEPALKQAQVMAKESGSDLAFWISNVMH